MSKEKMFTGLLFIVTALIIGRFDSYTGFEGFVAYNLYIVVLIAFRCLLGIIDIENK